MLETLKSIIKKIAPETETERITPGTHLIEDLGFDSLSMMLMTMEIEESFSFRFEETVRFETVGQVIAYLNRRVYEQ
ncbi:MAG: acyl carrier protein [Clostridia bacterium]|nr:acyl carrier protein [Clostridia bacterium]